MNGRYIEVDRFHPFYGSSTPSQRSTSSVSSPKPKSPPSQKTPITDQLPESPLQNEDTDQIWQAHDENALDPDSGSSSSSSVTGYVHEPVNALDMNILNPARWVASMKTIEEEVLHRSFWWYNSQTRTGESHMPAALPEFEEPLPQDPPVSFLEPIWSDLIATEVRMRRLGVLDPEDQGRTKYWVKMKSFGLSRNILLSLCRTFEKLKI